MTVEQYHSFVREHKKAMHAITRGNPVPHPNLPELVAEARSSDITVQLVTNGIKLADRINCDQLKTLGLTSSVCR